MSSPIETEPKPRVFTERLTTLKEAGRDFDIAFWQAQDTTARFRAGWELVVHYHIHKGGSLDELRLQRTVEHIQRPPR